MTATINNECEIYDGIVYEKETETKPLPKHEGITYRFKENNKLKGDFEYNQEHKRFPKYKKKRFLVRRSNIRILKEQLIDRAIENFEKEFSDEEN